MSNKDGKYISPVGRFVYITNSTLKGNIEVMRGTVAHMTAHVITIEDHGHTRWIGWGPGMMMSESHPARDPNFAGDGS